MKLTREQRIEAESLADSMDREDMAYEIVGLRADVVKLSMELDSSRTCKWSLTRGNCGLYTISCNGKRVLPYLIDEHPFCMFCGSRIELSPKPTT